MESSLNLSDIFEKYNGTSDATIWLQQTKVIEEMQDVELAVLFPVLLGYAVYDGLGVEDKKGAKKVLLQAFSLDTFTAYELFKKRKVIGEKQLDVFLTDLIARQGGATGVFYWIAGSRFLEIRSHKRGN